MSKNQIKIDVLMNMADVMKDIKAFNDSIKKLNFNQLKNGIKSLSTFTAQANKATTAMKKLSSSGATITVKLKTSPTIAALNKQISKQIIKPVKLKPSSVSPPPPPDLPPAAVSSSGGGRRRRSGRYLSVNDIGLTGLGLGLLGDALLDDIAQFELLIDRALGTRPELTDLGPSGFNRESERLTSELLSIAEDSTISIQTIAAGTEKLYKDGLTVLRGIDTEGLAREYQNFDTTSYIVEAVNASQKIARRLGSPEDFDVIADVLGDVLEKTIADTDELRKTIDDFASDRIAKAFVASVNKSRFNIEQMAGALRNTIGVESRIPGLDVAERLKLIAAFDRIGPSAVRVGTSIRRFIQEMTNLNSSGIKAFEKAGINEETAKSFVQSVKSSGSAIEFISKLVALTEQIQKNNRVGLDQFALDLLGTEGEKPAVQIIKELASAGVDVANMTPEAIKEQVEAWDKSGKTIGNLLKDVSSRTKFEFLDTIQLLRDLDMNIENMSFNDSILLLENNLAGAFARLRVTFQALRTSLFLGDERFFDLLSDNIETLRRSLASLTKYFAENKDVAKIVTSIAKALAVAFSFAVIVGGLVFVFSQLATGMVGLLTAGVAMTVFLSDFNDGISKILTLDLSYAERMVLAIGAIGLVLAKFAMNASKVSGFLAKSKFASFFGLLSKSGLFLGITLLLTFFDDIANIIDKLTGSLGGAGNLVNLMALMALRIHPVSAGITLLINNFNALSSTAVALADRIATVLDTIMTYIPFAISSARAEEGVTGTSRRISRTLRDIDSLGPAANDTVIDSINRKNLMETLDTQLKILDFYKSKIEAPKDSSSQSGGIVNPFPILTPSMALGQTLGDLFGSIDSSINDQRARNLESLGTNLLNSVKTDIQEEKAMNNVSNDSLSDNESIRLLRDIRDTLERSGFSQIETNR